VKKRLRDLVRRFHIYIALLNLTVLLLLGVVGVVAGFEGASVDVPGPSLFVPYNAPAGATDRQVARQVYELLKPSLASPVPDYALSRDAAHRLQLDFYSPNGVTRVIVLESERRLRITQSRAGLGRFLVNLHSATMEESTTSWDWRIRLWTVFTEISIWSLLGLVASGLLQWLLSRPAMLLAQISLLAGALLVLSFYLAFR